MCECDTTPPFITVEFKNVDNNNCDQCETIFDGNFITLTIVEAAEELCVYYSNFADAGLDSCYTDGNLAGVYAEVIDDGGTIKWQVTLLDDDDPPNIIVQFDAGLADPNDCSQDQLGSEGLFLRINNDNGVEDICDWTNIGLLVEITF